MNHVPHRSARSIQLENLESRRLLSGNVDLAAAGFEQVQWNGQHAYAVPGQFVLSLNNVNGRPAQQLNAINKVLENVRNDVRATRLLGADGLTLLQGPKGLTHAQLHASLRNLPGFVTVEPDFAITASNLNVPNDTHFGLLWGLHNTGQSGGKVDADIDAPEAWSITRGDGSVVVGVIDSGVDYTHPDLAGAMWTNPGEIPGDGIDNDGNGYVDDVYGWDFANNDHNPMDDNGHGTHVAGTIAAAHNNGQGIAGVADAKVMALKFLRADGTGTTSAAIAAINYATQMKQAGVNVRVTNNSWGSSASSTALADAVKRNGEAGMLFIAAAGNGGADRIGDNNDVTASYPANYSFDHVISVAATDRSDNLAAFSNYGAKTVHLSAPGVAIASTYPNGGYVWMDGTSMAAPHVAGAAALAFSHLPSAEASHVKAALLQGVDPVASMGGKSVTGGRLNAHRTLELLSAPATPSGLVATGGSNSITLAWADNATTETGYLIERALDGVNFSPIATVPANSTGYVDSSLPASMTLSYRVQAYNAVGMSGHSNVATATTAAAAPAPVVSLPAAPSGLTASVISQTQIRLAWTDQSNNESGFRIERSSDGRTWSQVASVGANATSYVDGGLKKKTTYSYRVRAWNSAGNSAYTPVASATTLPNGPATVSASTAARSVFSATPVDAWDAADAEELLLTELV